mgnify:CR=1 FL=1
MRGSLDRESRERPRKARKAFVAFCSICVQASLFLDFWRDGDDGPATRLSGRAWTRYCLHPPQKLRRHSPPQGPHLCVRHIKIQVFPQSTQGHNFSGLLGLVFELEEVEETEYDIEDQLGQLTRLPRPVQRSLLMGEGFLTCLLYTSPSPRD